ncbi:MAG: IMPACT family protein [Wenzhouxiangella sp.]|nr:IMPACT family protein [Wenzhouxiangella sp.]
MNWTLSAPARHEALIKQSRFIAMAERIDSETTMRDFLDRIRQAGASHHCWAWRCQGSYRFDDDGEPGGTAGRPILQAIEGQHMDQGGVVVIRHYGGIKLGPGGRARAYGGCAAECLRLSSRQALIETARLTFELAFEHVDRCHQQLVRFDAEKVSESYSERGARLEIELPADSVGALRRILIDLSRGQVLFADE